MKIKLTCSLETYTTAQANRRWHFQIVYYLNTIAPVPCSNSLGTKGGGYKTEKEAIRAGKAALKKLIDRLEKIGDISN